MRLSKTVEQACCILAIIAEHRGESVTNTELNERMRVSQSYLTKITRKLVVASIISSSHGVNGGFILAKPMKLITLGAVVSAIEGRTPYFTSRGVIEKAFPAQEYIARIGVSLLCDGFVRAEQKWFDELNHITMEQLICNVKGTTNT